MRFSQLWRLKGNKQKITSRFLLTIETICGLIIFILLLKLFHSMSPETLLEIMCGNKKISGEETKIPHR